MTDDGERARPAPQALQLAGTETETILGSLDRMRSYVEWKCGGLDRAGLAATLGPSAITLGGLLKHLAHVEDDWFSVFLHDREPRPPWDTEDWAWDWSSAAADTPDEIYAFWRDAVDRSRVLVAEALADGGLDRLATAHCPTAGHRACGA